MKKLTAILFFVSAFVACTENDKSSIPRDSFIGVVGGKVTTADEAWARKAVAIYISTILGDEPSSICTGSAIDSKVILTAAHCFTSENSFADVRVALPNGEEEIFTTVSIIPHPDFDIGKSRYPDLAILVLDRDLPASVEILKLPSSGEDLKIKTVSTAGFGNTSGVANHNSRNGTLHSVDLDVTAYKPDARYIEVDQSKGKGVCTGDSGGPAITEFAGVTYLVGITKGGNPSPQHDLPYEEQDRCNGRAYFTNLQVPLHLDWILNTLMQLKDTGLPINN